MSHDGAWTLARSMKRNKMLRERVMDNNRGGVAEKVTEPIPTFHLHNTHYNTFIYFIFKDNYFSSVIVFLDLYSNYRHFSGNDIRYTKISEKVKRYHRSYTKIYQSFYLRIQLLIVDWFNKEKKKKRKRRSRYSNKRQALDCKRVRNREISHLSKTWQFLELKKILLLSLKGNHLDQFGQELLCNWIAHVTAICRVTEQQRTPPSPRYLTVQVNTAPGRLHPFAVRCSINAPCLSLIL